MVQVEMANLKVAMEVNLKATNLKEMKLEEAEDLLLLVKIF